MLLTLLQWMIISSKSSHIPPQSAHTFPSFPPRRRKSARGLFLTDGASTRLLLHIPHCPTLRRTIQDPTRFGGVSHSSRGRVGTENVLLFGLRETAQCVPSTRRDRTSAHFPPSSRGTGISTKVTRMAGKIGSARKSAIGG